MVATVTEHGLVQVMRNLLVDGPTRPAGSAASSRSPPIAHRRRLRVPVEGPSDALAAATRERLGRQRDAGVVRSDVDLGTLAQFLELAYDGLVLHLAMGRPADDLDPVLDLVEAAVRRPT